MPCTLCEKDAEIAEVFRGHPVILCDPCSAEILMEAIAKGLWFEMQCREDEMEMARRLQDPNRYENAVRRFYEYGNNVFTPWLFQFFKEIDSGDKECPYCKEHVGHLVAIQGFPLKPCLKCYYKSILAGVVLDRGLLAKQVLLYRLKSPDYLLENQAQLKDEAEWMRAMYRFYVNGSGD